MQFFRNGVFVMPSHSIHLLVAYNFEPNGSPEFYTGCIAPDAVRDREDKDRTHLRDLPEHERPGALAGLSRKLDLSRGENLGAVLHLYTDILWDTSHLKRYIESYGEGWFLPYRHETAIAGAWMFHHMPHIRRLWEVVADAAEKGIGFNACKAVCEGVFPGCEKLCGTQCGDVRGMILYNFNWNKTHNPEPSQAFPPSVISEFANHAARSFAEFLKEYGL